MGFIQVVEYVIGQILTGNLTSMLLALQGLAQWVSIVQRRAILWR
jgi:hypothetical protein